MKQVPIAEFKAHCSRYVEDVVDEEEIVITKHGKPVARLLPPEKTHDLMKYVGILKGQVYVDPDDDLLSTGIVWNAERGIIT